LQLPHWGKGLVVLVLVLFVKFLFFWWFNFCDWDDAYL
jgi:hypothetical protein